QSQFLRAFWVRISYSGSDNPPASSGSVQAKEIVWRWQTRRRRRKRRRHLQNRGQRQRRRQQQRQRKPKRQQISSGLLMRRSRRWPSIIGVSVGIRKVTRSRTGCGPSRS